MRLIDADVAIKGVQNRCLGATSVVVVENRIIDMLNRMPTVDAVSVIRCVDCEYGRPYLVVQYADNKIAYKTFPWCGDMCYTTNGNGFCSWAERREDA